MGRTANRVTCILCGRDTKPAPWDAFYCHDCLDGPFCSIHCVDAHKCPGRPVRKIAEIDSSIEAPDGFPE